MMIVDEAVADFDFLPDYFMETNKPVPSELPYIGRRSM